MDYRYSNHVPGVQTSASIRGESCQAELCHVSCVNLLQHNEKTAVALHLIQFHPLSLPPSLCFPLSCRAFNTHPHYLCGLRLHIFIKKTRCHRIIPGTVFLPGVSHIFPLTKKKDNNTDKQPKSSSFFQVGCFLSGTAAVNDVYIQS